MARRAAIAMRCGLVQVVRLHWSKAARGGIGARERSTVWSAFEVPAAEIVGDVLCVDVHDWSDSNAFAEPLSVRRHQVSLAAEFAFGCVTVSAEAARLRVRYRYDQANGGAPDRWFFNCGSNGASYGEPGPTLVVRDSEWARVCYNGRFSCIDTGNWWYQQVTVNVAWFDGEPDGRVFLAREPSQELRALAELW